MEHHAEVTGVTVAALMCCHNRRESTLRSVSRLFAQELPAGYRLSLFVVDDGSTDGTRQALETLTDDVNVLVGEGDWYWARSMGVAEDAALSRSPDYLLWLNDDTFLDDEAILRLLTVSRERPSAIVVGATRDPVTGEQTYGGRIRTSSWHPQRFRLVPVRDVAQDAEAFNGNVVLVPILASARVGRIDTAFPHAYADDDYGLRATAAGVPIVQAPGSVGVCERQQVQQAARGFGGWRALQNPKGLPWRAQARYWHRHGGPLWLVPFGAQQLRMWWPKRW